jgi:hypothetical protein
MEIARAQKDSTIFRREIVLDRLFDFGLLVMHDDKCRE